MSVLLQKERLQKIVDGLTTQEIATLKSLVDTRQANAVYKDINGGNYPITNGIYFAVIKLEQNKQQQGFVIYPQNATKCTLIAFNNSQYLKFYEIDPTAKNYIQLDNEDATISDLRRVLIDSSSISELTPEDLASVLEGSDSIAIDLNVEDDKLQAKLDLSGAVANTYLKAVADTQGEEGDLTIAYDNPVSRASISDAGGLVTPTQAPSVIELVGIDSNGAQVRIQVDTNDFEISGSTSPYTLKKKAEPQPQ